MQELHELTESEGGRHIRGRATFAAHPEGCACEGRRPEIFDTRKGNIVITGQAVTDDLAQELGFELPVGSVAVVVPREMLEKHLHDSSIVSGT